MPQPIVYLIGVVVAVIVILALYKFIARGIFGTVIVGNAQVGIVNKKWSMLGKNRTLPDGALVALNGEAGIQADTLAPGERLRQG